ncbi:5-oxoprolinase subunit PxpB [Thalassotalea aquiviva]|uniref:5-oxoprolinase subunit PxpB n=1 Tax=Thalassotalea aquiviva TaxID=3242415 RepID=UPI00352AC60B
MKIDVVSDEAIILYVSEQFNEHACAMVQYLSEQIAALPELVVYDLIPAYHSLMVIFDPFQHQHFQVINAVNKLLQQAKTQTALAQLASGQASTKEIILPAYYGQEVGWDLAAVATTLGLTQQEVITLHHKSRYQVFAIGFAPGFAYLGKLDKALSIPRLASPRLKVPQGAIAIAQRQTAVYPQQSPGGWHIIGRCPQPLFNPNMSPPIPFSVGDTVKFRPIDQDEYIALGGTL